MNKKTNFMSSGSNHNRQYIQDFNVLISIDFKKVNETIKKLQVRSELSLILQNEKILINVTLSKINNYNFISENICNKYF